MPDPSPHRSALSAAEDVQLAALASVWREATRTLLPAFQRLLTDINEAIQPLRPLLDHLQQHPEILDDLRRERDQLALTGSCSCLCGTHHSTHPDIECAGTAVPGLEITYNSPNVGTCHIPHCRPCWTAKTTSPLLDEPHSAGAAP